ncbi:hypothetical protein KZW30_003278 [Escherichia coli]|nr:hypothetical protein [Escherichia coli]EHU9143183.1 hypothetical protein [Escherichia coli]
MKNNIFTLKQETFRCALFRTIDHSKLPLQVPRDVLISQFQFAVQYGCIMDFSQFEGSANGGFEPSDEQLESALSSFGWMCTGWKINVN